ncbi:hypothetical protein [Polaromonas sp.]|uniref:hypothetical protein n=1 Tax=Polaromonas sp. TaxID=1869339 RepID=UPI0013BE0485|nr:hypothetical protein [Polaromonas sp.]NDP63838.1 hypothetical protein [Polaromonas sp.]
MKGSGFVLLRVPFSSHQILNKALNLFLVKPMAVVPGTAMTCDSVPEARGPQRPDRLPQGCEQPSDVQALDARLTKNRAVVAKFGND